MERDLCSYHRVSKLRSKRAEISKGDEDAIYNPIFVNPTQEYKNPTFDPELSASEKKTLDNLLYSTLPRDDLVMSNEAAMHYDTLDPKTLSTLPTLTNNNYDSLAPATNDYDSLMPAASNKEHFDPYESIALDDNDDNNDDDAQDPIYELVEDSPSDRTNSFTSLGVENPLYGGSNDN